MLRLLPGSVLLPMLVSLAAGQPTAKLSGETIAAYDDYVRNTEGRLQQRLSEDLPFLHIDDQPGRRSDLRDGEILIETPPGIPDIPGGLLHVWRGAMFVPEITAVPILQVLQDYDHHQELYPEVIDSRLLGREGDFLLGYQRLLKKKVLTAVLDTEHRARYRRVSEGKWTGRSVSTRITEIKDAGEAGEKELPVGEDSGFLWRLNVYWALEEADRGVFVECLTVSLSRRVPRGLGWLVQPFVNSLPRESLEGTLQATREAARKLAAETDLKPSESSGLLSPGEMQNLGPFPGSGRILLTGRGPRHAGRGKMGE